MKNLKIFAITLAVAFGTMTLNAQNKKINVDKSKISWVGKKVTGKHEGTIDFQDGTLVFKSGKIAGGSFTVNMPSITVTDLSGKSKENLEGHLKSDDFFGTEKFGTSKMEFKKIATKDKKNYTIFADLTIKDITNPITFDMVLNGNTATSTLKIDRTKYDIRYGSGSFFDNLGNKAIDNEFELTVNLEF